MNDIKKYHRKKLVIFPLEFQEHCDMQMKKKTNDLIREINNY